MFLCASLGTLFSSYCTEYIFLVCFKRYFIYTVRDRHIVGICESASSGGTRIDTKLRLFRLSWCIVDIFIKFPGNKILLYGLPRALKSLTSQKCRSDSTVKYQSCSLYKMVTWIHFAAYSVPACDIVCRVITTSLPGERVMCYCS